MNEEIKHELEVWLCPVHESLDKSGSLEPLDNCVACLRAQRNELRDALRGILKLLEDGQLVRNTSNDPEPDWALRQMPFVLALSKAQRALDEGTQNPAHVDHASLPTSRDAKEK